MNVVKEHLWLSEGRPCRACCHENTFSFVTSLRKELRAEVDE